MEKFVQICCVLIALITLGVPTWMAAQHYKKHKKYNIPAIAKICGPNMPVPDYELSQRISQVYMEGCPQAFVIQTEEHFYHVYGVKVLIGEVSIANDVDTAK